MAAAAPLVVRPTTWRGKPAWHVAAAAAAASPLSFVVASLGGHLSCLVDEADAARTNPLWQPEWPPGQPADAAASGAWGEGPEAPLLSSIVGSNLCLDRFGAPHPGEQRPLHGEVGVTVFAVSSSQSSSVFSVSAELPLAGLRVTRSFALKGATLSLTTRVQQLAGAAAPKYAEWCEHTTLGGAFLDGCAVEASVDTCVEMPESSADGVPLVEVEVARALAVPAADAPPEGHVRTCRVAAGSWSATNGRLGWRLAATFSRDDFPWLCLWTEHLLRKHEPWAGRQRTRGMEMSTKPFPEGLPPASRAESFMGRPAAFFVPAQGEVSKTIVYTWARTA